MKGEETMSPENLCTFMFEPVCTKVTEWVMANKKMRETDSVKDATPHYYSLHSWPEKMESFISPLKKTISPDEAFIWEKINIELHNDQTDAIINSLKKTQNETGDEDGEIENNIQRILFGHKQLEDMMKTAFKEEKGKEKFRFIGIFILGTRRPREENPLRLDEILTSLIMAPQNSDN